MMRVIPGASSQTGLRLLVITDNDAPPTASISGASAGVTCIIGARLVPSFAELAPYLNVNGRPLCLFHVVIEGLSAGTRYTLVVSHPTWAPDAIRFTTLPTRALPTDSPDGSLGAFGHPMRAGTRRSLGAATRATSPANCSDVSLLTSFLVPRQFLTWTGGSSWTQKLPVTLTRTSWLGSARREERPSR